MSRHQEYKTEKIGYWTAFLVSNLTICLVSTLDCFGVVDNNAKLSTMIIMVSTTPMALLMPMIDKGVIASAVAPAFSVLQQEKSLRIPTDGIFGL